MRIRKTLRCRKCGYQWTQGRIATLKIRLLEDKKE